MNPDVPPPPNNDAAASATAAADRIHKDAHTQATGTLRPPEVKTRQLAALVKAIDWSHVVGRQIERLHRAERDAVQAEQSRRHSGEYRQQDREPFARLRAETYFLLGAVRQLVRAVEQSRSSRQLPKFAHGRQVLLVVRNAAEHWDDPKASQRLAKLAGDTTASWDDYTFTEDGSGTVIAGVLPVNDLEAWAQDVQAYLLKAERDWR